jgi:hypothetical protein
MNSVPEAAGASPITVILNWKPKPEKGDPIGSVVTEDSTAEDAEDAEEQTSQVRV